MKNSYAWRIKRSKSYCGSALAVLPYNQYGKTASLRLVTDFDRFLSPLFLK